MDYLAMFPDTFEAVRRYPPADRCYLYEAMGQYAFGERDPEWPEDDLKWLVWESLRQKVDALRAYYEKQRMNGQKGGRPKKADRFSGNPEESKETQENPQEPTETSKSKSKQESKSKSESKQERRKRGVDEPERFERFWAAYPRHTAKQTAMRAFHKLNPDETLLARIISSIEKQKQSDQWTRDGGAYIPHPATWLNQERWNDELPLAKGKTVAAQQYEQRDYSHEEAEPMPDWMMERWKRMQEGTTA